MDIGMVSLASDTHGIIDLLVLGYTEVMERKMDIGMTKHQIIVGIAMDNH